ncbi:MAG: prepilin-type N-terminal cleavage/methylation domain-containing protein [Lachnospiraceae bacterium]|nr:prepilin-type N-terminal cleavage/methylation domain-containing protein [Lachnospiraceae bacterium]
MVSEKQRAGKLHNGGYSLIELVIVLAIIAIIMSTVFYSIILVFSANAKSTANDIQRSIGDCKVTTMGRSAAYMELYRNTEGNVYTQMYVMDSSGAYVPSEPQKVGPNRVTVKYRVSGTGSTETELLAGDSIQIWFDRASGGFKEDAGGNFYDLIRVEGGSKNYEIRLTKLTGKSEVKAVATP